MTNQDQNSFRFLVSCSLRNQKNISNDISKDATNNTITDTNDTKDNDYKHKIEVNSVLDLINLVRNLHTEYSIVRIYYSHKECMKYKLNLFSLLYSLFDDVDRAYMRDNYFTDSCSVYQKHILYK